MADVLVYPIAESARVRLMLGKALAQKLGKPYPIPGTRIGAGIHGPGGETLYASDPVESKSGTQVAFELLPVMAADAGKTITVDGRSEVFPTKQTVDLVTWSKVAETSEAKR
jgi:hypothetical protein